MAKIVPNQGLPELNTPEFFQWLKDFHARNNSPEQMQARAAAAQLTLDDEVVGQVCRDEIRLTPLGRTAQTIIV